MKYTYQKICVICSKPFDTGRIKTCCCSPECRYQRRLQINRENQARRKQMEEMEITKETSKRNDSASLAEVNAKARAAGMSYGQYMLMQCVGRTANG